MTSRTVLLGAVAALLLVIMVFAVFVMGGSGEEGSDSGMQTSREQDGADPSSDQDDQSQDSGEDGRDQSGGEPSGSSANDPEANDADSAGTGDSDGPASGSSEDADSYENIEDELSERQGGGVPEGEVAIEDEEGRSNGQRGFVSGFVGAAYGYTGSDPEAYLREAERRVDTETYYDSPGGDVLRETQAVVEDGGAESAAVLAAYRIIDGPPVKSRVSASGVEDFAGEDFLSGNGLSEMSHARVTFALGDRYGDPSKDEDFGQVYGNVGYYSQELLIRKTSEGGWQIVAGGVPQQTEDPNADRPPPGAPKVADPIGPGQGGHDH